MAHFYFPKIFFLLLFFINLVSFTPFFVCIDFMQILKNLQQAFHFMETVHFTFSLRYFFSNFLLAFRFQKLSKKFHLEMNYLTCHFIQRLDSRHLRSTRQMDFSSDKAVLLQALHLKEVPKNLANQHFELKHYLTILIINFYVLEHTINPPPMQMDFYLFFINYYQIVRHLLNLVIFLEIHYRIHPSNHYLVIHLYQMMMTNLYLFIL